MKKTCGDCFHFVAFANNGVGQGECRRNAPKPKVARYEPGVTAETWVTGWALTLDNEIQCGDFQATPCESISYRGSACIRPASHVSELRHRDSSGAEWEESAPVGVINQQDASRANVCVQACTGFPTDALADGAVLQLVNLGAIIAAGGKTAKTQIALRGLLKSLGRNVD